MVRKFTFYLSDIFYLQNVTLMMNGWAFIRGSFGLIYSGPLWRMLLKAHPSKFLQTFDFFPNLKITLGFSWASHSMFLLYPRQNDLCSHMRKFVRHHLLQNVGDINHISNVSYILIIIIYYYKLVVVVVVVVVVCVDAPPMRNLRIWESLRYD